MSGQDFIEIDGKYLEGGGQILRNAISFSCILGKPVRIVNIRANRPNPGLSNQHLFGLNLLVQITNAEVKGNHMKSTEVELKPGKITAGKYFVDTQTAASISLVLQTVIPVLIFAGGSSEVEIIGGTNVGMAPAVDFMTEVMRPNLEKFGASFDFHLLKRGFYPRGGGMCKVVIPSVDCLNPVDIVKFGHVKEIDGWCFVAGRIPIHLAKDMKKYAEQELKTLNLPYNAYRIEYYQETSKMSEDNGAAIILRAITSENCILGSSALGERKVEANKMGTSAGEELRDLITKQICVDSYVQDQLILYMALAKGPSQIHTGPLTKHTQTAIYVAELMCDTKFKTEDLNDGNVLLSCEGIGHQA